MTVNHTDWIAEWMTKGDMAPPRPEDVAELVALVREDRYPLGATVFKRGQAPARVHIVRQGAIELSRTHQGRRIVIQILRPGDVVGDISLFLRIAVPWDAIAIEESLILSMDSVQLYRLLEQRPRLSWTWLHSVSTRVAGFWFRVVELLAGGLEAQVASVLLRRAEDGVLNISQNYLAELVGGTRTSVNRVLKALEGDGLVRVRYGQIEILNAPGLAVAAGLDPEAGSSSA